jgi:hypothetical protein
MNEFLFGEPDNLHEIIFANDRETAIRYFHAKVQSPELYVPDAFIKTDNEGHWVGYYHDHLGFIPEYTPEAGIPLYIKDGSDWKFIENILLSSALKVIRGIIKGPHRLPGKD